jgi:type II secretory pathway pseudopilin PulG
MTQTPPKARASAPDTKAGGAGVGLVMVWLAVPLAVVAASVLDAQIAFAVVVALLGTGLAVVITLLVQAAQRSAIQQSQVAGLEGALDALRADLAERAAPPVSPIAQSKIDALAAAQEQTDTRLTLFFSRRAKDALVPSPKAPEDPAPRLALDDAAPSDDALSPADLIRALHFPEDETDTDGFEALRRALADSRTASLIRAAQEVLTHLAQDGIYMDDLRPDRARPEFWRAFAQGTRGTLIAPLGGIRDRSCLALTAARMRNNSEFKTAAHLFLREFDRVFAAFEKDADDAQIAALSETRSARAFMLLGRVNGVFSR